ncbi:MAG: hypothetical protein WD824_22660 [Cyclobacteriaceae bacterium]
MRQKLLLVCVLAVCTITHAQKASIKKVELAGEKIIVHYDLEDSNPSNEYQIQLYTSQSNFATALTKVSGDVGNEVKPGYDKKIEWKVREELGPFKGRLALEIRGRMFMAVARINSISAGDKFKRGKSALVNWRPGNTNPINIELLKDGDPVKSELNQPNNGAFNLFIPQHSKVGKDYTIRITDTKNTGDFVISQPFAVTRKVPLALKVLPVVAIGGAVLFLGGGGTTKKPTGIEDPPELP